ncbi:MAG: hypothetical protein DI540_18040 [Sphingobium sp.]|nr:MAG: hypothetical protein DI540_18040 [Sphingobium sp.]
MAKQQDGRGAQAAQRFNQLRLLGQAKMRDRLHNDAIVSRLNPMWRSALGQLGIDSLSDSDAAIMLGFGRRY